MTVCMTESFSLHWSLKMFQTADQTSSGLAWTRTGLSKVRKHAMCGVHATDKKIKVCVPPTVAFGGIS